MRQRIAVAALMLSALGFSGRALHESFTANAVIPVPNDPPTIGLGSTRRDDGTPVQIGDKITVPQAIRRSVRDIGGDEKQLRACFDGAALHQYEWDAYVNLSYNVGPAKVCNSSIVAKAKGQQYEAACKTILDFYKAHGLDCRVRANGCYGVWLDRVAMTNLCLTGDYPAAWGAVK